MAGRPVLPVKLVQSEDLRLLKIDAPGTGNLNQPDRRLGSAHARERLRIEAAHEQHMSRGGMASLRTTNLHSTPKLIRGVLKSVGLYRRARANAARVQVEENILRFANLPEAFDGFTILHISDMHVDISEEAMRQLAELLPGLRCDLCVLTGDFRGKTYGPFEPPWRGCPAAPAPAGAGLCRPGQSRLDPDGARARSDRHPRAAQRVRADRPRQSHDPLRRHRRRASLSPRRYRQGGGRHPETAFSILLSHTPEVYREAASAGFDLLLGGHTHGGQICLPGAIPITLDSVLPRRMGSGAWAYDGMTGYTSVGVGSCVEPVRLNCPPSDHVASPASLLTRALEPHRLQ